MSAEFFDWPVDALPVLGVAGRFPLSRRNFGFIYLCPTHALHVHGYAATMRMGNHEIDIQPGDVTLTPAGVESAFHLPRSGLHWCVHFQPALGTSITPMRLPLHYSPGAGREYPAQQAARVSQLRASAVLKKPVDPLASAAAAIAFQELLIWIAMGFRQAATLTESRGHAAVERVAALIESRLSEPLTIPALADEAELSQNHLARLFRKRFGMTLPHYLLTRRMAQARHLLISTNIPIGEIARRVGMPDPQHFNKQFRRLNGTSPTLLRAVGRVRAQLKS